MPLRHPTDPPRSTKGVLPFIFLLIAIGVASPFLVNIYHTRQLANNERDTIAVLRVIARAQNEYFSARGEYTDSFLDLNQPDVALAQMDEKISGIHCGYKFRILRGQLRDVEGGEKSYVDEKGRLTRGFALLAVPGKYGVTGRDTFFLDGLTGKIYARDFGPKTQQQVEVVKQLTLEHTQPVADPR